jgi:hypothetical protein
MLARTVLLSGTGMVGGGLEPGVQKVPKAGEFSISRKV